MQLLPGEEPARVGPQPPPVDQRPSHRESGQIHVLGDAEIGKEAQFLVNDGDPRPLRHRRRVQADGAPLQADVAGVRG